MVEGSKEDGASANLCGRIVCKTPTRAHTQNTTPPPSKTNNPTTHTELLASVRAAACGGDEARLRAAARLTVEAYPARPWPGGRGEGEWDSDEWEEEYGEDEDEGEWDEDEEEWEEEDEGEEEYERARGVVVGGGGRRRGGGGAAYDAFADEEAAFGAALEAQAAADGRAAARQLAQLLDGRRWRDAPLDADTLLTGLERSLEAARARNRAGVHGEAVAAAFAAAAAAAAAAVGAGQVQRAPARAQPAAAAVRGRGGRAAAAAAAAAPPPFQRNAPPPPRHAARRGDAGSRRPGRRERR